MPTRTDPDVSVIIVTLADRTDDLEPIQHLDAKPTSVNYEVIVRTDPGICRARNAGIRQARADNLVFLDDDCVPCEGYLDAMAAALDNHPLVAGHVTHPDGIGQAFTDHWPDGDEPGPTDALVGCNMGFRRAIIEDVGGFDEAIDWGHDEALLADRARQAGYDIWYEPAATVEHAYADGVLDLWQKWWRLGKADAYYALAATAPGDGDDGHPLWSVVGPSAWLAATSRATAAKVPARLLRNTRLAAGLLRYAIAGHPSPADPTPLSE